MPRFHSDQEERDYWARHSVEEFAEELQDLDVAIRPPRTEQIAVRLYKDDPGIWRPSISAVQSPVSTLPFPPPVQRKPQRQRS